MEKFKKARLFDAGGDLQKQWYVYFFYQHPETKDFTRIRQAISTRLKTKLDRYEKASSLIKDINLRLMSGWNPFIRKDHEETSVVSAILKVVELKSYSTRKRTHHSYSHVANLLINYMKEKNMLATQLEEFSFRMAQDFLDWAKVSHGVSNRTYNNYVTTLRTFFNFLMEREYILINPFNKVKKLPKTEPQIISFTPEELTVVRENLPRDNFRLWACCQLVFCCFIRPAEIMRMHPGDFDLDRQVILVHGYMSKNRRDAVVGIPDHCVEIFRRLELENIPPDYYVFSRHLDSGSKMVAPTRMAEVWRKWANRYNINKCIYHLKHTGAGMALQVGVDARTLQLQMRHGNLETTQVYLDRFRRDPGDVIRTKFPSF